MGYEVHVGVFDGPFELLLQLISAQEVDLYEVSLVDIVDGYLAELARMDHLDLEVATEFLLIAATLVELKCRRLLPGSSEVDLDEDLALFEARDYLLARLLECRMFSAAASALAGLEASAERSVPRRCGPDDRFDGCAPDLLAGVTPSQLRDLARRGLAGRPAPEVLIAHLLEDEVSVSDALGDLVARLPTIGTTTFRELTASSSSRAHAVALFLALLELYKQEIVALEQLASFGEIEVRWLGPTGSDAVVLLGDDYDDGYAGDGDRSGGGAADTGRVPAR